MIAPTPLLPTPVTDTKWIDHDADHGVRGPIRLSEDSPPEECGRASSFGVAQQSVAQRSAPPEVLRGRASTPHSVGQRGRCFGSGTSCQARALLTRSWSNVTLCKCDELHDQRRSSVGRCRCGVLPERRKSSAGHCWCIVAATVSQSALHSRWRHWLNSTRQAHRCNNVVGVGTPPWMATGAETDMPSAPSKQSCRRRHCTRDGGAVNDTKTAREQQGDANCGVAAVWDTAPSSRTAEDCTVLAASDLKRTTCGFELSLHEKPWILANAKKKRSQ